VISKSFNILNVQLLDLFVLLSNSAGEIACAADKLWALESLPKPAGSLCTAGRRAKIKKS
jgi:hypothetical protein